MLLAQVKADILKKRGKEKQKEYHGNQHEVGLLSTIDKDTHNTREEIAKYCFRFFEPLAGIE